VDQVEGALAHRGRGQLELGNRRVHRGARAHVDTAGRLVEQEHARRAAEPAGKDHLLLVATRQRLHRLVR
jgi:hypothetical protein